MWKASCELVLKGKFYEKCLTDILLIIKRYREVDSSFKKQTLQGESVYLRTIAEKLTLNLIVIFNSFTDISFLKYITKISCYFLGKIWKCFKVQFPVVVFMYILSSKEANQLQELFKGLWETMKETFLLKLRFSNVFPAIFSGNL